MSLPGMFLVPPSSIQDVVSVPENWSTLGHGQGMSGHENKRTLRFALFSNLLTACSTQ
jgi:hypothetical protein